MFLNKVAVPLMTVILRTFFRNYEVVSKITGIDKELKRTYVILQIMESNRCIDVARFRKYANDTAELYVSKYS